MDPSLSIGGKRTNLKKWGAPPHFAFPLALKKSTPKMEQTNDGDRFLRSRIGLTLLAGWKLNLN